MRRVLASLVLCAAATPALATCPGQTQMEMNACASEDYAAADARLNHVWGQVKPQMDAMGAGDALLDAQRKWIAFRDAACLAERMQFQGGSIAPLIHFSCLTRLTERRTDDLRGLMN